MAALNELEKQILRDFCLSENLKLENLEEKLTSLEVKREHSPVGFFTSPIFRAGLKLMETGKQFKGGRVGAKIGPEKIDTGYLIFIKDWYLEMLEGYTYEEPWPSDIGQFETYMVGN